MLYVLILYHSFSSSNSIILIIFCIQVLIVRCLHNLKLNLMWYAIFIKKNNDSYLACADLQSNQSISRHCLPSSCNHEHLEKWRCCSWLMTSSKYEFHNWLFEYASSRTVYIEAAVNIHVFLFLNITSPIAICLHSFLGHHRIKSSKTSPFYQWIYLSDSSFLQVTLRFRQIKILS